MSLAFTCLQPHKNTSFDCDFIPSVTKATSSSYSQVSITIRPFVTILDMPKTIELDTTSSLENLQTDDQRRVLDTVAQVRKCGLEGILSLPQLVVCGDQSAGKSSVLEALTEIPFPRADNLCTRFATEIILRRAAVDSLTIRVIPDSKRNAAEQESIKSFEASIMDFTELPTIMEQARAIMGIDGDDEASNSRAFARDVLSIEIEGPSRPQLTLVDLPGLIQNETKGVTKADVELVKELTQQYVSQPRTICLAVIAATNDYANQGILNRVQAADPEGERTIGIITKPDRLPAGSGSEKSFIALARNEDIFFKLGWHVLKNRAFEEGTSSFEERNAAESSYFRTSNFKTLPPECVGIDALRNRLSLILFEHIRRELPKLRNDLQDALAGTKHDLELLGKSRGTTEQCRDYVMQISLDFYELCRSAVNGHYEGDYFNGPYEESFSPDSSAAIRRLRAIIQLMNVGFAEIHRKNGHTYAFDMSEDKEQNSLSPALDAPASSDPVPLVDALEQTSPIKTSRSQAFTWISQAIVRNRGRELQGNFNPLLIGELFWKQSYRWRHLEEVHVEEVANVCTRFLNDLLQDKCPKDVRNRVWSSQIQEALKERHAAAIRELNLIVEDLKEYPINYSHYYTDTTRKRRQERDSKTLTKSIEEATQHVHLEDCESAHTTAQINITQAVQSYAQHNDPDMARISCEEVLDCMLAIYKVRYNTFKDNLSRFQS